MSASPLRADSSATRIKVRYVPLTDIPWAQPTCPSSRYTIYLLSVVTVRSARRSAIFQIAAICGASLVR
jgi:hypothetical protein